MSPSPTSSTQQFLVECHNNRLATSITRPAGQPNLKPSILILHGSGGSNHARSLYVAEHFAKRGVATLRFDHSGHGASTGHIRNSSLDLKLAEATAMLAYMQPPIHIIGSSMGAHIATLLTQSVPTATMVFIAPAIYSTACHTVPFGPDFEFLIKLPAFWRHSPAWPAMQNFTGKFLLVTAGREQAVHPEVAPLCWNGAANASARQHLHFPNSDHSIQQYLDKHPEEQQQFLEVLTAFIAPQK